MLTAYQTATSNLLQKPGASTPLYDTASITSWINTARGQLAGEAECIRFAGTISTVVGQRSYDFSGINTGVAATNGVKGVIHVRSIRYNVGSGSQWIAPRPSEWFDFYALNNPVPSSGAPTSWSQYGQGSAGTGSGSGASGSFYIDPLPDAIYVLNCSTVCYPQALVDDTTVEAIPFLWTDAVPYFAAYLALLSAQTGARTNDAQRMFDLYTQFVERARRFSNPDTLRWQYLQATDVPQAMKLGIKPGVGGAGAA